MASVFVSVELDETFEARLFVVDVAALSPPELSRAIGEWSAALKRKGDRALLEDPALEDAHPWFGFGVRHHGVVLDEVRVFEALGEAQTAPVEQLVRDLVAFNRENAHALEGGLVTHEERETGSAAVQWLVERDLRHLGLYIAFLETLDLDHTVAQVDVVLALARRYTSADLRPLSNWVAERRVQLLSDWLANDRAWKV